MYVTAGAAVDRGRASVAAAGLVRHPRVDNDQLALVDPAAADVQVHLEQGAPPPSHLAPLGLATQRALHIPLPIPVVRVEHVDHCELHLTAVPVAAFLDDHHAQTRVKQGKYPGEVLTVVVLRLLAPLVELDDIGALQNLGLGLKLGHALGPVLAAAGRCAVGDGRVVLSNQRVGVAADRAGDQPEPRFLDARELAGLRQFLEQLVRLAVHGQQPDRRDRRQVTP